MFSNFSRFAIYSAYSFLNRKLLRSPKTLIIKNCLLSSLNLDLCRGGGNTTTGISK